MASAPVVDGGCAIAPQVVLRRRDAGSRFSLLIAGQSGALAQRENDIVRARQMRSADGPPSHRARRKNGEPIMIRPAPTARMPLKGPVAIGSVVLTFMAVASGAQALGLVQGVREPESNSLENAIEQKASDRAMLRWRQE
jgi:hypothetical protein